jgi:hypothetical protein
VFFAHFLAVKDLQRDLHVSWILRITKDVKFNLMLNKQTFRFSSTDNLLGIQEKRLGISHKISRLQIKNLLPVNEDEIET